MSVAANGRAYGYFPMSSEALGYDADVANRPDLREAFSMGPQGPVAGGARPGPRHDPAAKDEAYREVDDFCYQETPWPREGRLRELLTQHYEANRRLTDSLLVIFAQALGVDPDFFLSKTARHASSMRVVHYPALAAEPIPGQLRCGAHSDICTMTLLWQDVDGGLEVLFRDGGEWTEVSIPEDGFFLNLGDLMMRWTNDQWFSTPHRVVCPGPDDPVRNLPRISMPFFQILSSDAVVECIPDCLGEGEKPKYEPITQGSYLMNHFKRWGRNRGDGTDAEAKGA